MRKLTFHIHETQHKEWLIQGLLPLTQIPLMQQNIDIPKEVLVQAMRIEVGCGYPRNDQGRVVQLYLGLSHAQSQIVVLIEKIKEFLTSKGEQM